MTLEQLRIFVAVAEREHLTRAAESLELTPSAVSSAIKSLEDRHGTILFHRIGRGIALTEAGHLFLGEAKATLARAEFAELALIELGGLNRGSLSLHASRTIAGYWIPDLLVRFHEAHPAINLRLDVGETDSAVRSVFDGSAEIGFVEGEVNAPDLEVRIIAHDHLVLVVAPRHPWASGSRLAPRDLAASRWIMRETGSATRSAFESALRARNIEPDRLDVALVLPSDEAVISAVRAGSCSAALSELVAAPDIEAGRLIKVDFKLPPRAFRMLRHKERFRTKASLAFESLLAV